MPRRYLFLAVSLCASLVAGFGAPTVAEAAPFSGVLVSGPSWAGSYASLGDLNVYSNGPSLSNSQPGPYGGRYQCTELAKRWIAIRWGEPPDSPLGSAASWWNDGGTLPVPLVQHPNGGADRPQFGDILVFGATSYDPTGHVSVVTGSTATGVSLVEQNWSSTSGRATIPISGTTMPPRWGLPILGWLRPTPGAYTPAVSGPGGYSVDGYGGLHPWGSAPRVNGTAYWGSFDIARGIAKQTGKNAGYVLDGYGPLHAFGGAPYVNSGVWWGGFDIARGVALRADGISGYVLDGYGGLHAFGGAPQVTPTGYWPGWDIARGLTLRADGKSGWVLDGYGGLHPFGGAPWVSDGPYWGGWDVARGVTNIPGTDGGYIADAFGVIHPFGGAAWLTTAFSFENTNLATGVVWDATDNSAYVGFRNGAVSPTGWGSVPADIPGMPVNRGIA